MERETVVKGAKRTSYRYLGGCEMNKAKPVINRDEVKPKGPEIGKHYYYDIPEAGDYGRPHRGSICRVTDLSKETTEEYGMGMSSAVIYYLEIRDVFTGMLHTQSYPGEDWPPSGMRKEIELGGGESYGGWNRLLETVISNLSRLQEGKIKGAVDNEINVLRRDVSEEIKRKLAREDGHRGWLDRLIGWLKGWA